MEIKTYRASSLHEALDLVRQELGADAAVLQTREIRAGWLGWGRREIEVTASVDVQVPSRLPPLEDELTAAAVSNVKSRGPRSLANSTIDIELPTTPPPLVSNGQRNFLGSAEECDEAPSVIADRCDDAPARPRATAPAPLLQRWSAAHAERQMTSRSTTSQFDPLDSTHSTPRTHTDHAAPIARGETLNRIEHIESDAATTIATRLIENDIPAELAHAWIDQALDDGCAEEPRELWDCVVRLVARELAVTGPLQLVPGQRRVVALVGPTGVGKTTTIAKLAAHYRIQEQRNVALVTVDTYRIAAVEQLRTYAQILDLPMEVVAAPRDMQRAIDQLADADLVLIDTAGRSPCDELRIHELRAYLDEAAVDEVHLVLAAGAQSRQLVQATQRFAAVGIHALLLTKLDECPTLGGLLPWLRETQLPVSYLTSGQNVPQDIQPAQSDVLALRLLGDRRGARTINVF